MKKTLSLISILALGAGIALSGCNGDETTDTTAGDGDGDGDGTGGAGDGDGDGTGGAGDGDGDVGGEGGEGGEGRGSYTTGSGGASSAGEFFRVAEALVTTNAQKRYRSAPLA